jgi:uncharacterized repeat protein (TIGR01451 family)
MRYELKSIGASRSIPKNGTAAFRTALLALGMTFSILPATVGHAQDPSSSATLPEEDPPELPPAIEGGRQPNSAPADAKNRDMQELPSNVEADSAPVESVRKPPQSKVDSQIEPVAGPGEALSESVADPDSDEAGPLKDGSVTRTQNEAPPVAANAAGGSGAQYRPGTQGVGVYVEVMSPPATNLLQDTTYRVIVKNAMRSPAYGVVVTDVLPDGLTYVKSEPPAKAEGTALTWDLGEMPVGSEKTLTVVAKPTKIGPMEHTATVACRTGTRARMVVQEPKLKVEQTMTPAKPLKGQPVQLNLVVSNPGTGAARNVSVVVKVSQGLQDSQGSRVFDQEIKRLGPGERMTLQTLTLMTVGGGAQTCDTSLTSADVATEQPESKASTPIEVLEPKLKMTFNGPSQKYTNTVDIYELVIENPGTAQARNVQVSVFVPDSKGVLRASNGHKLYPSARKIAWLVESIEPGATRNLKFEYRVEAMGTYPFTAEARGEGGLAEKQSITTTVTGVADVDFQLTENSRVIDVGKTTEYIITIRNHGTKDAVNLLMRALLSDNVQVVETDGHDGNAKMSDADPQNPQAKLEVAFPKVDHLPAGEEMKYVIRVKGIKAGLSSCRVFLNHEDLGQVTLEKQVATPLVTERTQISSTASKPAGQ